MSYERNSFVRHFRKRGVHDLVIANASGALLCSTISRQRAHHLVESVVPLAKMARNVVRDLDPANDLTFLRMRSEDFEIMVAPETDFTFIVVQNLKFQPPEQNF